MEALDYLAYALDAPKAARDLLAELDKTVKQIAERNGAKALRRSR